MTLDERWRELMRELELERRTLPPRPPRDKPQPTQQPPPRKERDGR